MGIEKRVKKKIRKCREARHGDTLKPKTREPNGDERCDHNHTHATSCSRCVSPFLSSLLSFLSSTISRSLVPSSPSFSFPHLHNKTQRLSVFVDRVKQVVKNMVQQLAMLYSPKLPSSHVIDSREVHLRAAYRYLGDGLAILATLDELIHHNDTLNEHMMFYKRMMKPIRQNPELFGTTREQLQPFDRFLEMLEGQVMEGMLFENCIAQSFDDATVSATQNQVFRDEYNENLRSLFVFLEPRVGAANDRDHREQYFSVCCLFVLFHQLFRTHDQRLLKGMWEVQRRLPAVHLYGAVVVCPNEFLLSKIPQLTASLDKKARDFQSARSEWLARSDASLGSETQALYMQVCAWMVRMENESRPASKNVDLLLHNSDMIISGLLLAHRLRHLVTTFVNLHLKLDVAMTRVHVSSVFRLVELLKAVQQTFHRRSLFVATTVQNLTQDLSGTCLTTIETVFARVSRTRNLSDRNLDVLAGLTLLLANLNGPGTPLRRLSCEMALHVANQSKVGAVDG